MLTRGKAKFVSRDIVVVRVRDENKSLLRVPKSDCPALIDINVFFGTHHFDCLDLVHLQATGNVSNALQNYRHAENSIIVML